MQIIWNEQNSEKMYAINEEALFKVIRKKGRSINALLNMVEWVMILVNFGVSITLLIDAILDREGMLAFALAAAYFAYAIVAVYFRQRRQNLGEKFSDTILGELDKAIWQTDYMMRQGHNLFWWYLVPLALLAALYMAIQGDKWLWAGFSLALPIVTYFAMRWEYRKWHRPRRQELESLRETLMADFSDNIPDHEL